MYQALSSAPLLSDMKVNNCEIIQLCHFLERFSTE